MKIYADTKWASKSLKECAQVQTGSTPSKNNESFWGGAIPFVTPSELTSKDSVSESKVFVTEEGANRGRLLPVNTVLVCCIGSLGKAGIIETPSLCNQQINTLTFDSNVVDYRYGYRFCSTLEKFLNSIAPATTVKIVKKSLFEKIQIPLPPLEEQKRIAAILDDVDESIRLRKASIDALDELIQSTFISMFGDPVTNPMGWDVGKIGDLMESVNYGTSKKADIEIGNFPILRMNNITYSGGWNFSSLKYIEFDEIEQSKYLVHKGQILFNRTNSKELVGKTAVYREKEPMAFAGYLVRGCVSKGADPEYIGAFMNLAYTKQNLRNMCKSIVGMANINAKEFQKIRIPIPPLEKQKEFAAAVESIEERKEIYTDQLKELENLFGSLQQRAFKGEL